MSHKKFGPDRFSRFDVYWIQTNKPTNRQTDRQTDKPNLYIDTVYTVYSIQYTVYSIQSSLKPHPLCVNPCNLSEKWHQEKKTFLKWRVKMPAILTL